MCACVCASARARVRVSGRGEGGEVRNVFVPKTQFSALTSGFPVT